MNDDQYLLASAYLDGELTGDQRVAAEADPDVMSEVDRMLALQVQVRSVEPPSATAREAAIGAAMAAFSVAGLRPAPPAEAVTRTVEFRRRPLSTRYLGVAAALVAIGMLGLVVANGLKTGDDDAFSSQNTKDQSADQPAAAEVERVVAEPAESAEAEDAASIAAPAQDLPASAAGADQPASESDGAVTEEAAIEPAADTDVNAAPPAIDPDQPLTTPAELGGYGAYLVELRQAGVLPATPETACSQQVILGSSQYVLDGLMIDVLVAVDEQQRTVSAIDPDTCELLVVGPLF